MGKKDWKVRKTLLIVGEGYHEEAFLTHVKQFPGACGNGVRISIKNARGKGALNVVNYAIRLQSNVGYDHVAAFCDADTDWNQKTAAIATKAGVQMILSEPCLEALLLRVIGGHPGQANQLKDQFAPYVGHKPGEPSSYSTHFNFAALDAARGQEVAINELLALFGL